MPVSVPGHLELWQPSLENPGWLTSLPAWCPSAHVRHPWLSTSRMLNKLRSLPFVGSWASVTSPPWDSCFQSHWVEEESRSWIFTTQPLFQGLDKRTESNSEVNLHTLQSRLKNKWGGGGVKKISSYDGDSYVLLSYDQQLKPFYIFVVVFKTKIRLVCLNP